VTVGVAAHVGYLSHDWVIARGFFASVTGDQLYLIRGRRHGTALLARRLARQASTGQVLLKLERHLDLLICGYRLLYGLRSVPFAIGLISLHSHWSGMPGSPRQPACQPASSARARAQTLSTVNPYSRSITEAGAETPKRSTPSMSPRAPM
jgi:hypothetical protein